MAISNNLKILNKGDKERTNEDYREIPYIIIRKRLCLEQFSNELWLLVFLYEIRFEKEIIILGLLLGLKKKINLVWRFSL